MPIVVNPGYVWPPETDPVVSPDGRITAIVDPAHAGVLLRADFDDSVPDQPAQPEKVLRRNLFDDPSFEGDVNHFFMTGGTLTTEPNADGNVAVMTADGSQSYMYMSMTGDGIPAGGKWVAGAVRVESDGEFRFRWATYGTSTQYQLGAYTASHGDVITHTFQMPAGQTTFLPTFQTRPGTSGMTTRLDKVIIAVGNTQAEAESYVSTYFDGSTTTSGTKNYRWIGTANASVSEEYTPATPFIPGHGATVARVRFERQDGTLVRSGNPAWAPGGYAHAYDHEATLGGGTLWRAVPIHFDGTEGEPSEYVGAVIPALSDGWAWLKPVNDPDKAMLLKVEPPDLSYDGRVDTTSITGAPRPAATWDVLEGFTTQLRSLVREKTVADQLMALLDEGPVLAQFPSCAGLSDFYFIRGGVNLEHVHWDGYPWRRYQWDVISIDRPDTSDSPLRIPDLSYDTVERDWITYDQLAATVDSYNKLLEP